MMDTVYAALGRFDVRFRYLIVVAWIVVTIVCIRAFPSLDSVIPNASFSSFLPSSSASIQATNLESPFRNFQYASATIVASRESGTLTPQDEAAISRLATLVRTMPHVKTVRDLSTSSDGQAMEISIQADVPTGGTGSGVTLVERHSPGLRSGKRADGSDVSPYRTAGHQCRYSGVRKVDPQRHPDVHLPPHYRAAAPGLSRRTRSTAHAPTGGAGPPALQSGDSRWGHPVRHSSLQPHPGDPHRHHPGGRYRLRPFPHLPCARGAAPGPGPA